MNKVDLFTGLGGFIVAGQRVGINTIFTSEIDNYNCKLIEQNLGLDNAGDVRNVCLTEATHPYQEMIDAEDIVPVEHTGFSSLCMEDFYEGVLPFPDIITGGFPCQEVTQANLHGSHAGIKGKKSGLVGDQLRIIEALEPEYCVFENAKNLNLRGLDEILVELHSIGYEAQWATVSATAWGYPHYRHRTYLVAYLPTSNIAMYGVNIFESIKRSTVPMGEFKLPTLHEDVEWIKDFATVLNTRSIALRTKRINSLGNAIIPDIAESIFSVLIDANNKKLDDLNCSNPDEPTYTITDHQITCDSGNKVISMAAAGFLKGGFVYEIAERDLLLNPTNTQYKDLFSTLILKDGNNNFTCKSRLNRPGKLGGLVGDIMSLGVNQGGLDPAFCEWFMGYEIGYTELRNG